MSEQRLQFLRDVDIVALISEYVTLRRHGREFLGLCPFHAERTPSFTVNPEKGFWYCHGCHEGGDSAIFIQKIEGISRGQAIRSLAERQGVSLGEELGAESEAREAHRDRLLAACAEAARAYTGWLAEDEARTARAYLTGRGIDRSCATTFGLGYAPAAPDSLYRRLLERGFTMDEMEEAGLCARGEFGPYDRMRQRVIIPVADAQGRVIAFGGRALGDGSPKYLNSPETALFHKSRTLYMLHLARKAIQREASTIIVEGYLDALTAHYFGIDNVVATLGTSITAQHIQILQRLAPRIVLALDADSAGVRAVERTAPLLEQSGMELSVAGLDSGMDPDGFLRQHGPERFREKIQNAVGIVEYRLVTALNKADLNSQEGKSAALQECTKILAAVQSPILRDKYVDDLARLWVGSQAMGEDVLDNIELVREEVVRQIRSGLGSRRRSVSHRLAASPVSRSQMETEQSRIESELLAGIMRQPSLLQQCRGVLTVSDFRTPTHQTIYSAMAEEDTAGEVDGRLPEDSNWLSAMTDEDTIRTAASILAASESIMNPRTTVEDCLQKVKDFDARVRLEELRRKFNELADGVSDAIGPHELQEYYRLSRHLKPGGESATAVGW